MSYKEENNLLYSLRQSLIFGSCYLQPNPILVHYIVNVEERMRKALGSGRVEVGWRAPFAYRDASRFDYILDCRIPRAEGWLLPLLVLSLDCREETCNNYFLNK